MEEFEDYIENEEELLFDGTENPIERPQDFDLQKDSYSGKKKRHTEVALLLTNKARWIYYVSELYFGKEHDFAILKTEFEPGLGWFKNYKLIVDLGFVGIDKHYEIGELMIGHKKPYKTNNNPNPELSQEQKEWNKAVSKERIYVEHAIGGMKRFRMLVNRGRGKCIKLKNEVIGNCAALWNYKLLLKEDS